MRAPGDIAAATPVSLPVKLTPLERLKLIFYRALNALMTIENDDNGVMDIIWQPQLVEQQVVANINSHQKSAQPSYSSIRQSSLRVFEAYEADPQYQRRQCTNGDVIRGSCEGGGS